MTGFITIMLMFAAVGLMVPGRGTRFLTIMFAAGLLPGLMSSPATSAGQGTPGSKDQVSGPAATAQRSVDAARREAWRASMARTATPKKGCFTATYPNSGWQEVPCTTPPPNPQGPRRGLSSPQVIGNGNDV